MQFDSKKVLSLVVRRGILLHFAPNTYFGGRTWHYAVVVNSDPANEAAVVVACITSKYPERVSMARRLKLPPSTVVELQLGAHPKFTSGTSGIDCNHALKIPMDDLASRFSSNQVKLVRNNGNLDSKIVKLIIEGIKDSPVVAANVRLLLED